MTKTPTNGLIKVDNLTIGYSNWGGDGPPIVLVHGLASTRHIWNLVAPVLTNTFQVVTLDQRGHGDSSKPDTGYDFQTVANDLRQFTHTLGIKEPILAGHSWGGNVILEYAATYPSEISGLCLVDGGTIEISGTPGITLELARESMAPPDFSNLTVNQLRNLIRSRNVGFDITPEIETIMLSGFEVNPNQGTVRPKFPRESHMAVIDAFWVHHPSELYPSVKCPTLLMPTKPPSCRLEPQHQANLKSIELARSLLTNCKTVWLRDSVHDVPLQRPELVGSVINNHLENGFFE